MSYSAITLSINPRPNKPIHSKAYNGGLERNKLGNMGTFQSSINQNSARAPWSAIIKVAVPLLLKSSRRFIAAISWHGWASIDAITICLLPCVRRTYATTSRNFDRLPTLRRLIRLFRVTLCVPPLVLSVTNVPTDFRIFFDNSLSTNQLNFPSNNKYSTSRNPILGKYPSSYRI